MDQIFADEADDMLVLPDAGLPRRYFSFVLKNKGKEITFVLCVFVYIPGFIYLYVLKVYCVLS